MLAFPPGTVHSQDSDTIRPSQSVKPIPIPDTAKPTQAGPILEQIAEKKEELKSNVKSMREESKENFKRVDNLERLVDKLPGSSKEVPPVVIVVKDTKKVFVPPVRIIVRDTSLDGKTWWGAFFATNKRLMKECKLHNIFRKRKK